MYGGAKKKNRINTSGTIEYYNRTKDNKRKQKIRTTLQSTRESRASNSLYHLIVLPDKPRYYIENMEDPDEREEVYDWWAENTVDFLNEIQLIYATMSEDNNEWLDLCSKSRHNRSAGYPKGITYRWKVTKDSAAEIFPVNAYIDHIFAWCDSQIQNEDIFPSDEDSDFPANFPQHLSKMFGRLLRVFHIICSNECLQTKMGKYDNSLDLCLKHFVYFGWKWQLLREEETNEMKMKVPDIRRKFLRDQKEYFEKKLPYMGE